jgi:hypothetical protein
LGVFDKFVGDRKGRDTYGYGVKIMKMNEKNDQLVELSRG